MGNAMSNRLVTKEQGLALTDHKGELIKFEEQEDGSFKGSGSESDGNTFTYYLEPVAQPQYTVRVVKTKKGEQESATETVGSTFKDSEKDKDKGKFVQEYGLPAAGKQTPDVKNKK